MEKNKIFIVVGVVVAIVLALGFLFYQNMQISNDQANSDAEQIQQHSEEFATMDETNKYLETDPEATAEAIYTASYEAHGPSWADKVITNWDAMNQYNMLTEAKFDETITDDTSGEYKVVYFFQYGCSHCENFETNTLTPTYGDMQNTDNFYVYNAEYYGMDRLTAAAGSEAGTPTIAVYQDGQVITTFVGPNGDAAPEDMQAEFKSLLEPYGFF